MADTTEKAKRSSSLRRQFTLLGLAFVLIAGTAFAAYLLESTALLALMGACLLAWVLHLGSSRPAYG